MLLILRLFNHQHKAKTAATQLKAFPFQHLFLMAHFGTLLSKHKKSTPF